MLIIFAVLLALTFTVGAEAKNGEREKKFFKMFPVPQVPQNNNNNGNNTYNYYYYNNDDYYYDRRYRGDYYYYNDRCGWITLYRQDRYGRLIEYQKYHCQGQRD